MREVFAEIEAWNKAGKQVAIATNVKRNGMSLRPLGAKMAMTTAMEIAGSVTGGCIEGAVYEEGQNVINTLKPKLLHYGVTGNEKPWDIGLACGTSLDVFVESMSSPAWQVIYPAVRTCMDENQMAAIATIIQGPGAGSKLMVWPDGRTLGDLNSTCLNEEVKTWAQQQMSKQEDSWSDFPLGEEKVETFVDILEPKPRLIIIGAGHIAISLVSLAKILGFKTIVIDPREAFANRERFPHADELIKEWPVPALDKLQLDESCYVAVISHDEKLDNPALAVALARPTRYVGVLGTRKNIDKRRAALREMGVTEEQLRKLRAPIGIHLGAILPDEIALSILSEMVSAKHGLPRMC